jgi:hypothetical protein
VGFVERISVNEIVVAVFSSSCFGVIDEIKLCVVSTSAFVGPSVGAKVVSVDKLLFSVDTLVDVVSTAFSVSPSNFYPWLF